MSTSQLGLISQSTLTASAGFLAWNWFYAYCLLSSRTLKQIYGIDNQANPRQDLNKYAETAIKEGKLTREQLGRIQRMEGAGANSTDGFIFFTGSCKFDHQMRTRCVANNRQKCCSRWLRAFRLIAWSKPQPRTRSQE